MCAKPVRADHSHVIIITMSQLSKTSLGGDMGLTLKTLTPEPSTVTRPRLVLPTTLFGAFALQGGRGPPLSGPRCLHLSGRKRGAPAVSSLRNSSLVKSVGSGARAAPAPPTRPHLQNWSNDCPHLAALQRG